MPQIRRSMFERVEGVEVREEWRVSVRVWDSDSDSDSDSVLVLGLGVGLGCGEVEAWVRRWEGMMRWSQFFGSGPWVRRWMYWAS